MKLLSGVFIFILLITQCKNSYADPALDQALATLDNELAGQTPSEKEKKLVEKFEKKLPKIKKKIASSIAKSNMADLNALIVNQETLANHYHNVDLLNKLEGLAILDDQAKKTALTQIVQDGVTASIPRFVHHYILTGKWTMNNNQDYDYLKSNPKWKWEGKFDNSSARLFAEILGVFLILLCFGISYPVYLAFLLTLCTVGIISAFSPHIPGTIQYDQEMNRLQNKTDTTTVTLP
jgi:hypothetical protein